jgi:hypothetical protein
MTIAAKQIDNKTVVDSAVNLYYDFIAPFFSKISFNTDVIIAVVDGEIVDIWRLESKRVFHERKPLILSKEGVMAGWYCGPIVPKLDRVLGISQGNGYDNDLISGSSLDLYLDKQAKKLEANSMWPYATVESYQAALLHEFGHIAYNSSNRCRFVNSSYNQTLLRGALSLFQGEGLTQSTDIFIPKPALISEVFAFCTEYHVSQQCFPEFKLGLDAYYAAKCEEWAAKEADRDTRYDYSSLDEMYTAAAVIGRVLIERHPHDWPTVLIGGHFNFG